MKINSDKCNFNNFLGCVLKMLINLFVSGCVLIYSLWSAKRRYFRHYRIPKFDYVVSFHAAIGEEFVFRILPSLLFPDYTMTRMIISCVVFSGLHFLSLTSVAKLNQNMIGIEIANRVVAAFYMGYLLSILEVCCSSILHWYIICCSVHVINNIMYLYTVENCIRYGSGTTNGFVVNLSQ